MLALCEQHTPLLIPITLNQEVPLPLTFRHYIEQCWCCKKKEWVGRGVWALLHGHTRDEAARQLFKQLPHMSTLGQNLSLMTLYTFVSVANMMMYQDMVYYLNASKNIYSETTWRLKHKCDIQERFCPNVDPSNFNAAMKRQQFNRVSAATTDMITWAR